jgi:meso-butanediol dehydrogenase / (S,S)-butanediol dehydrogenase / diacetyl reductase
MSMGNRLAGKVVVITGTGDGIARSAARMFAAQGASVVGCDLNEEKSAETAALVKADGGEMTSVHPLDVSDEAEVERLMDIATDTYGGVDVVLHTAMLLRFGKPEEMSAEDVDYTLSKVVTMSFVVAKCAIPRMRARGGGAILLTGSMSGLNFGSGFTGNTSNLFAYSTAKGAVTRLGIALATHLGRDNIRVNVIAPGPIVTPAVEALYGKEGSELLAINVNHHLLRRLGQPEDVAAAALFLASDEAKFITGVVLPVDGGFTASGGVGGPTDRAVELVDAVLAG